MFSKPKLVSLYLSVKITPRWSDREKVATLNNETCTSALVLALVLVYAINAI